MKTLNHNVVGNTAKNVISNTARFSTQFQSRKLSGDDLFLKRKIEGSVRMGDYEVKFKRVGYNTLPMSGHSEFWIS